MEEKRNAYRVLVGKPLGKETTEKTKTLGGWTISNWVLER
jgi:hypothetical protein